MKKVRFNRRSQVTIPKAIVDHLNLKEGDHLDVRIESGKIIMEPTIILLRSEIQSTETKVDN